METLKVLLVNGSPHKDGCVSTALSEIADTLKCEGVDSTLFWVGNQPVAGCIGCGACVGKRSCFRNDRVNEFVEMMDDYDGFVFGTPVHYDLVFGPGIFHRRVQRRPFRRQTCRSDSHLPTQRCDSRTRPDEQIHGGLQYAHRAVAVLECSTREYAGGDSPGYGRTANHAYPCAEHGVAAEMYRTGS